MYRRNAATNIMSRRNAKARQAPRVEIGSVTDKFQRVFIQHHHEMMAEWMEQHKAQVDEQNEAIKEAQKWQMWGAAAFGLSAVLGLLVNMNRKK
jgi:hypothetical protein